MNPYDQFDTVQKPKAAANPYDQFDAAPQPPPNIGGSPLIGTAEGLVNSAAGVAEAPIEGLAGIAGLVKGALTPGDTAANASQRYMQGMAQFLNKPRITIGTPEAQQGLKTRAANQAVQQAVSTLSAVPGKVGETVMQPINAINRAAMPFITGHPLTTAEGMKLNAAGNAIGNVAGNLGALMLPSIGRKVPAKPVPKAWEDMAPVEQARAIGYKIAPTDAPLKGGQAGLLKRSVEGLAGSPKLKTDLSVVNQPTTNSLAAQEIGLPKDAPLTPENINEALLPHYKAYSEMKSLGEIPIDNQFKEAVSNIGNESSDAFPLDTSPALNKLKQAYLEPDSFGANGAVLKIRQLRKDGNLNISSRDPEKMQLGYAQREIANQIENQIDRYASSRPEGFDKPNAVPAFRKARQEIAKIETVRDSILPGTTDVSARALAKKLNRGQPLSGNLMKIAEMYNNFKPAMQDAGPLRNKTPINAMEGLVGGGLGTAALMSHNPALWKEMLFTLGARPLTRKALLSGLSQNALIRTPPNPMINYLAPNAAMGTALGPQANQNLLANASLQNR